MIGNLARSLRSRYQRTVKPVIDYYGSLQRTMWSADVPRSKQDLPVWLITRPNHLWKVKCRYEGYTFGQYMPTIALSPFAKLAARHRSAFSVIALGLPLIAAGSAARHRGHFVEQFERRMQRPDLVMGFPLRYLSADDVEQRRPDELLGLFYAYLYSRNPQGFFELDDKNYFAEKCRDAGFPVADTLTFDQAVERIENGHDVVVKDAREDLGASVRIVSDAADIGPISSTTMLQNRLANEKPIAQLLADDAALATLRVVTETKMVAEDEVVAQIAHAALRLPRTGSSVDNFSQGGLASNIDLATGRLNRLVTKQQLFQARKGDELSRCHPDTGASVEGVVVPDWRAVKEMCVQAHQSLAPNALTLGWDVALTPDGPLFIELNVCAGSLECDVFNDQYSRMIDGMWHHVSKSSA